MLNLIRILSLVLFVFSTVEVTAETWDAKPSCEESSSGPRKPPTLSPEQYLKDPVNLRLWEGKPAKRNGDILTYVKTYATFMSAADAEKLAGGVRYDDVPAAEVILEYVKAMSQHISVTSIIYLKDQTHLLNYRSAILLEYVKARAQKLSLDDMLKIRKARWDTGFRNDIANVYYEANKSGLSPGNVARTALLANDWSVRDGILIKHGRDFYTNLSAPDYLILMDGAHDATAKEYLLKLMDRKRSE